MYIHVHCVYVNAVIAGHVVLVIVPSFQCLQANVKYI